MAGSTTTFPARPAVYYTSDAVPSPKQTEAQIRKEEVDNDTYVSMVMKPKFTRAPITEAGRVAFLGESSNLTLLVHDRQGASDVVHYPLPENVRGSRARLTELDNIEIDILHQRGAFLLPPRQLCDELIEAYFQWIHPIVPVINRASFMRQYRDPKNPPSLLLLQAVLLAGSRVCHNQQLMDANGSTTPAALTFYKRAKALYDANYEDDRVTIVQSLLLMGWYWEGPEDVTKNVFYWSRVAIIVAQGTGMHRSVEGSQLNKMDKRLWKRIWWTLFTRDRAVAVALGRPCNINLDDCDVEMLTEDDFIDDEDPTSEFAPDPIHVNFFLQYVKLCEIMGLVLSQQYSVASRGRRQNAIDLTHSDMALADWLQNCPKMIYWEMPRHHFWSALLHSHYYTTLCLLHRAHMPPNSSNGTSAFDDHAYPSRNIAFQAAGMMTSIVENLSTHDELRYCPAFIVYSLFSALIMHVYQMRSPVPSIQRVTQDRIRTCMDALKEVSKVWLVGKMVYTLFESILGNKVLEERLQKAAGKRHKKVQQTLSKLDQHQRQQEAAKRKYDEMAIDFSVTTPTPQESYERSRPVTPRNEPGASQTNMGPPTMSPGTKPIDAFMGGTNSRPQTRPATPFNPSFSVPTTPPDLYLITRNSPNLSQSLWENFQPDQLFPESTGMPLPQMSPPQNQQGLDPNLISQVQAGLGGLQGPSSTLWPGGNELNNGVQDGHSPSDSWSTGSQGQPVPATLNVEDWFQFFGISGNDVNLSGIDIPMN
ncbi:fungal-specific transcription factor domain-containing protein [Xylariaceae sp. FL1019]|nr:fungal-specific transcription factor domain-containing protein [Xylariaceae sp. FL1019]